MRRASQLRWIGATFMPWILAAGVLVSFTAVASNDPMAGTSAGPAYRSSALPQAKVVAEAGLLRGVSPTLPGLDLADVTGGPEVALRSDMKSNALAFPKAGRAGKSAPQPELKASLSRRGLELARIVSPASERLAFLRDDRVLPPTILMTGPVAGPDWEASRGLEPWSGEPSTTTTRNASSVQSPAAAAAGSTGAVSGGSAGQGRTPRVSRAAALSSTTPAPADAAPVTVGAAPVSLPQSAPAFAVARVQPESRPRYADLIAPASLEREQRCLAEAVYFEARSEPEQGQAAVAQVVLNRVRSGLYPTSVCGVVYQNRHRHLACQFTFACEGKQLRISDGESWESAKRVARDVTEGRTYLADVGGSTHYHADYVRPTWARRLKKMDVIGRHIFYQLRPGQT